MTSATETRTGAWKYNDDWDLSLQFVSLDELFAFVAQRIGAGFVVEHFPQDESYAFYTNSDHLEQAQRARETDRREFGWDTPSARARAITPEESKFWLSHGVPVAAKGA